MNMELLSIGILVCLGRIIDVTLNTLKTKALVRGDKKVAPLIGFFELIFYTIAAAKAFQYTNKIPVLIMYALGYSIGLYIGMVIDEKMAKGQETVMIIVDGEDWHLADELREKMLGVTTVKGTGIENKDKCLMYVNIEKKDKEFLINFLNEAEIKGNKPYIMSMDVKSESDIRRAKDNRV